jgi:hypothetical protein
MSLPKYEHFRFEVGQFVRSSFCLVAERESSSRDLYQIVERHYVECPGGVQLFYVCRPQGMFENKNYLKFNEIELTELPVKESST